MYLQYTAQVDVNEVAGRITCWGQSVRHEWTFLIAALSPVSNGGFWITLICYAAKKTPAVVNRCPASVQWWLRSSDLLVFNVHWQ